jgi:hypothetical protein
VLFLFLLAFFVAVDVEWVFARMIMDGWKAVGRKQRIGNEVNEVNEVI